MKSNPTVGIRTEQQLIGVNDDGAGDDECLLDDPLATSFDPPRATSARGRMVNHHCRRRRRGWLEQGEKTAKKLGCAKAERKIQIKHISRIMINNTLLAAREQKKQTTDSNFVPGTIYRVHIIGTTIFYIHKNNTHRFPRPPGPEYCTFSFIYKN